MRTAYARTIGGALPEPEGHVKSKECLALTRKEKFCLASAMVASRLLLASPLHGSHWKEAVLIEA